MKTLIRYNILLWGVPRQELSSRLRGLRYAVFPRIFSKGVENFDGCALIRQPDRTCGLSWLRYTYYVINIAV